MLQIVTVKQTTSNTYPPKRIMAVLQPHPTGGVKVSWRSLHSQNEFSHFLLYG